MLYIISNDNDYGILKSKIKAIKNKVTVKKVSINDIEYFIVYYNLSIKRKLFNFLNQLNNNDYIYVSSNIDNDKIKEYENHICFKDYSFKCIEYIFKTKAVSDLFFVVSNASHKEFLLKIVNYVKNIYIVTNNETLFKGIYDECYELFGISLIHKNENYLINNSIILNMNNKNINIGKNNIIFSKENFNSIGNKIIYGFTPSINKKYLKNKPCDFSELDLFCILDDYYNDNFIKNIKNFRCTVNNNLIKINDIFM